ncbi:hypothetical protein [Pusillimonas sp. (ex Stolz et al. 2005)]|uniref:hypothetical protein n=1 Tax=Pusillimonas sp. (ex Stolz et al. 2005) TaxID=1979962 RepID=UPI002639F6EA|nr:hypothetical protein [Pusillimonas sp. (ex Stolz et al. 2005)]
MELLGGGAAGAPESGGVIGSVGLVEGLAPGLVIGSAGDAAGGGAVSAGAAVSSSFEHAASRLTDAAIAMTAR